MQAAEPVLVAVAQRGVHSELRVLARSREPLVVEADDPQGQFTGPFVGEREANDDVAVEAGEHDGAPRRRAPGARAARAAGPPPPGPPPPRRPPPPPPPPAAPPPPPPGSLI